MAARLDFDPIAEAAAHWRSRGWGEAAPGMAALTSVMRVQQILMARVDEVLRPMGLTFARYEALMLLSFTRRGSLPMGKIGARLQVHPASVTNVIARLEADGFVRRVGHPTDGRTVLAEITNAGRDLAGRATERLNTEVFCDVGLSDADAKELFELLRRVRQRAGDVE